MASSPVFDRFSIEAGFRRKIATLSDSNISVVEQVQLSNNNGDHEKQKHYVYPKHAVEEAMVTGGTVIALCGKEWTPMNHGEQLSLCKTCEEMYSLLPDSKE